MSGEIDSRAPTEQAVSNGRVFRALLASSVAFLVAAIAWSTWQSSPPLIHADDARLLAIGQRVYAEHCASCHGAKLEGQPAWRERRENGRLPAPPHDASGHTWHHPDAVLIEIVSNGLQTGRYAPPGCSSDMPGFANVLTEQEIRASLPTSRVAGQKLSALTKRASRTTPPGNAPEWARFTPLTVSK